MDILWPIYHTRSIFFVNPHIWEASHLTAFSGFLSNDHVFLFTAEDTAVDHSARNNSFYFPQLQRRCKTSPHAQQPQRNRAALHPRQERETSGPVHLVVVTVFWWYAYTCCYHRLFMAAVTPRAEASSVKICGSLSSVWKLLKMEENRW